MGRGRGSAEDGVGGGETQAQREQSITFREAVWRGGTLRGTEQTDGSFCPLQPERGGR